MEVSENELELMPDKDPSGDGRQFYESVETAIEHPSQWNDPEKPGEHKYKFYGNPNYWNAPRNWNGIPALEKGTVVRVILSERNQYRDIVAIELVQTEDPPQENEVNETVPASISRTITPEQSRSATSPTKEDPQRRSIERQVAHKSTTQRLIALENYITEISKVLTDKELDSRIRESLELQFKDAVAMRDLLNFEFTDQRNELWS